MCRAWASAFIMTTGWFMKKHSATSVLIPGSHWSPIQISMALCYLQFVIEKRTGRSLNELMEEKVFKKTGMKFSAYTWKPEFEANYAFGHGSDDTIFPKDKDNAPRSASTLETTLDDYAHFLE